MREIYLDNAATTKVDKAAADQAYEVMTNLFGNPSSRHLKGLEASEIIKETKNIISEYLSCEADNIIFTSGGTESNNLAIWGSLNIHFNNKNRLKKVITSSVEHSSVFDNMKKLESMGFKVIYVKPDSDGNIDPFKVWNLIDNDTVLVSVMQVNNETGNIYDIKEIVKGIRFKNKETIIHCDGVQAFGKIYVNILDLDIDLYSFSGHKIHAPKGIGGLYLKKGSKLKPMIIGGKQEYGYRCGTENLPGIAGLGKACEDIDINNNLTQMKRLNDLLRKKLSQIDKIHINSKGNILPYILNFSVLGKKSEIILNRMQEKNIFISNGSACSKGLDSKVLKGMDLDNKYVESAIRVSFSKYNIEKDVLDFSEELKKILK